MKQSFTKITFRRCYVLWYTTNTVAKIRIKLKSLELKIKNYSISVFHTSLHNTFLNLKCPDVILNVFLAIAVDNLTMTSDEEVDAAAEEAAAEAHMGEVKEKYAPPGEDV